MNISEPYKDRVIRHIGLWTYDNWQMKVYTITLNDETIKPSIVTAARQVAASVLIDHSTTSDDYGVGFIGIHHGKDANFVFVDWWANENELHHNVFISDKKNPDHLTPQTSSGAIACVWDLQLIGFERDAWVSHILCKPMEPDIQSYIDTTLNGEYSNK